MNAMLKLFGIGIICAAATALLRETKSPLCTFLPLAGCLCLFIYAVSRLAGGITALENLVEGTAAAEYAETLVRAVGIGYTAELTADVCKSSGAEPVASSIILLGRAELVVLACPLLVRLLETASSVIL